MLIDNVNIRVYPSTPHNLSLPLKQKINQMKGEIFINDIAMIEKTREMKEVARHTFL